ncbi:agamous-like MADS-box protein AGL104 isoform X2 [Capsicum annuum]|uniref:agamous-like MADS-box protein AGL104 isoform X2 n=1 Tax=Capsicum annuum TaxID=4072 RepID=UPI001FB0613F|nr:agamous-like MADS-box protein AGL104 isoform X2 [Capsicum annuum]
MGRNKLVMKKIEDSTSRQRTYSKHKDSLVKKANELAILCDTDVALLMFSPTGEVTRYSSRGSVEDVMLRIVNNPGELNRGPISNEQHLAQSLTESKHEGQMVEKIAVAEDHKKKLMMLNQKLSEAREKLRCYEPQVENISSVQEADAYQEFLLSAMEQIRSQARLLGGKGYLQTNENVGVASVNAEVTAAAGTSRAYKL